MTTAPSVCVCLFLQELSLSIECVVFLLQKYSFESNSQQVSAVTMYLISSSDRFFFAITVMFYGKGKGEEGEGKGLTCGRCNKRADRGCLPPPNCRIKEDVPEDDAQHGEPQGKNPIGEIVIISHSGWFQGPNTPYIT